MNLAYPEPTLDCQDCGRVIRHLNPRENLMVAAEPYRFIVYCSDCSTNAHPERLEVAE